MTDGMEDAPLYILSISQTCLLLAIIRNYWFLKPFPVQKTIIYSTTERALRCFFLFSTRKSGIWQLLCHNDVTSRRCSNENLSRVLFCLSIVFDGVRFFLTFIHNFRGRKRDLKVFYGGQGRKINNTQKTAQKTRVRDRFLEGMNKY